MSTAPGANDSTDALSPLPVDATEEAAREYGRQLAIDGLLRQMAQTHPTSTAAHASDSRRGAIRRTGSRRNRRLATSIRPLWWVLGGMAALLVLVWFLQIAPLAKHAAEGNVSQQEIASPPPETTLAVLDCSAPDDLTLLRKGVTAPVVNGMGLLEGDQLQTVHPAAKTATAPVSHQPRIRFQDSTVLILDIDTQVILHRVNHAQVVDLNQGAVTAEVAKQPPNRPMYFNTPFAIATVVGTRLRLSVQDSSTRLDVMEGQVDLLRLTDRQSVAVRAGQFAEATRDSTPLLAQVPATQQPAQEPPAQGRHNLLTNPDFEQGLIGWTMTISSQLSIVTTPVHGGRQALRIARSQSASPRATQTISVSGGFKYEVAGWIKSVETGQGDAKLWLFWYDGEGKEIGSEGVGPVGACDWTRISQVFLAPPQAVRCQFLAKTHMDPDDAGEAYFDDLFFGRAD